MQLRALLFDVDGTLADTEEAHRTAFNDAFRVFGLEWTWDRSLYGRLLRVAGGRERILHYAQTADPDRFHNPNFSERAREIHECKTRRYGEILASGAVTLLPGVERLIREARDEGLRLAIATTTTPDNVRALLEPNLGTQAMDWFDVIGAGDCVPAKKPAPDIYHWVMDRLGLSPSECLALEDSRNGLRAALAASLATLVTPSTYSKDDDFTGAAAILSDLGEPDRPFTMHAGGPEGWTCVTPDFLRALHRSALKETA